MRHSRPDYDRIQDPTGKIGADEPVFLIRAKDRTAPAALRAYAAFAEDLGASHRLTGAVQRWAEEMERWQEAHPTETKVPDLPKEGGTPLTS